jgi:LysR family hca operon transcriptional activator
MELRHLRYFIAVAEEGSFTRAARRLHTAQPSLSRQVQDLEQIVGSALLTRSSRRVALTGVGQVFLDDARLVIAQANRALERARLTAQSDVDTLSIGFIPGVEVEELRHVMDALEGGPQQSRIVLRSQSSPALIESLRERLLDVAFVRPSAECYELEVRIIRREGLIVALPATHRLAARSNLNVGELAGEPLIDVTSHHAPVLFDTIEAYAASQGVTLASTYQAENLMMALSLISTVGGICLLPERSVRLFPGGVVAVPFAGEAPTIELALAWHPQNFSHALKEFLRRFDH